MEEHTDKYIRILERVYDESRNARKEVIKMSIVTIASCAAMVLSICLCFFGVVHSYFYSPSEYTVTNTATATNTNNLNINNEGDE